MSGQCIALHEQVVGMQADPLEGRALDASWAHGVAPPGLRSPCQLPPGL